MNYQKLFDEVQAGNAKALPTYIEMKKHLDEAAKYLEAIKEQAVSEFQDEWGGKEQVIAGAMISPHRGGRYSYSDVPGWKQAKDKVTLLEKQAQLAFKAGGSLVDEETGELIPPAKYIPNAEAISVKFLGV